MNMASAQFNPRLMPSILRLGFTTVHASQLQSRPMHRAICAHPWFLARSVSRAVPRTSHLRRAISAVPRSNTPRRGAGPLSSTSTGLTPTASFTVKRSLHSTFRAMSTANVPDRYKLVFFVPPENLDACKDAIFATGAGSFPGGKYTKCCFETVGTGQFLPNEGATPAIGAVGTVEQCRETKVEVMCLGREIMLEAVRELIKAHPYEEVAYEVYRMENV